MSQLDGGSAAAWRRLPLMLLLLSANADRRQLSWRVDWRLGWRLGWRWRRRCEVGTTLPLLRWRRRLWNLQGQVGTRRHHLNRA